METYHSLNAKHIHFKAQENIDTSNKIHKAFISIFVKKKKFNRINLMMHVDRSDKIQRHNTHILKFSEHVDTINKVQKELIKFVLILIVTFYTTYYTIIININLVF